MRGWHRTATRYVSSSTPYHLRRPLKIKNEAGRQLLTDPLFNKGTAFTFGERDRLGIRGLLPSRQLTMEQQAHAVMETLEKEDTPMRKVCAFEPAVGYGGGQGGRMWRAAHVQQLPADYTPVSGRRLLSARCMIGTRRSTTACWLTTSRSSRPSCTLRPLGRFGDTSCCRVRRHGNLR